MTTTFGAILSDVSLATNCVIYVNASDVLATDANLTWNGSSLLAKGRLEVDKGTDAAHRDQLLLSAGATADQKRYIMWQDYDGTEQTLLGVNELNEFILYRNDQSQHIIQHLTSQGSGDLRLCSTGSGALLVNSESGGSGTGGFIVYDGASTPKKQFSAASSGAVVYQTDGSSVAAQFTQAGLGTVNGLMTCNAGVKSVGSVTAWETDGGAAAAQLVAGSSSGNLIAYNGGVARVTITGSVGTIQADGAVTCAGVNSSTSFTSDNASNAHYQSAIIISAGATGDYKRYITFNDYNDALTGYIGFNENHNYIVWDDANNQHLLQHLADVDGSLRLCSTGAGALLVNSESGGSGTGGLIVYDGAATPKKQFSAASSGMVVYQTDGSSVAAQFTQAGVGTVEGALTVNSTIKSQGSISAWETDGGNVAAAFSAGSGSGNMNLYSAGVNTVTLTGTTGGITIPAAQTSDTAPTDDTTRKKLTLQKLASPPTNAAYIAFSNNPGSDTFYLVMEEG